MSTLMGRIKDASRFLDCRDSKNFVTRPISRLQNNAVVFLRKKRATLGRAARSD